MKLELTGGKRPELLLAGAAPVKSESNAFACDQDNPSQENACLRRQVVAPQQH